MDGPAGMTGEPLSHLRMFVRCVVIENDMNDFAGRHLRLDSVEKASELLMPVPLHAAANHRSIENIEDGNQRGGVVRF